MVEIIGVFIFIIIFGGIYALIGLKMRRERGGWFWFLMPLAVGLLVPSLVLFYLEVFVGDIPLLEAAANILGRQPGGGNNLFVFALIGLIPFVALSVILREMASRQWSPARLSCLAVGGLVGIFFVMVPGHYSMWYPYYGSGDPSSTGILALVALSMLTASVLPFTLCPHVKALFYESAVQCRGSRWIGG